MERAVIDTNVAVVANCLPGKNQQPEVPDACILRCIQFIDRITSEGMVVVDENWRILGEYLRNLRSSGQPGVGDRFLKWILRNQHDPTKCEIVTITETSPGNFVQFPNDPNLQGFDPSDQKFVAVAAAHGAKPPIYYATDRNWPKYAPALAKHGITVIGLC
jgi:hypothetical protein